MKPRLVITIGLITAGLLAGSAWWLMARQTQPADSGPSGALDRAAPAVGELAPDFSLKTLEGREIKLASYRGQKPVVVDFWASWSPECRRNAPVLEGIYAKYKDQLEVIAVNRQEGEAKIRDFIDTYAPSFIVAPDPLAEVHRNYGNPYANTHFLIDKNGNIIKIITDDVSEDEVRQLLAG